MPDMEANTGFHASSESSTMASSSSAVAGRICAIPASWTRTRGRTSTRVRASATCSIRNHSLLVPDCATDAERFWTIRVSSRRGLVVARGACDRLRSPPSQQTPLDRTMIHAPRVADRLGDRGHRRTLGGRRGWPTIHPAERRSSTPSTACRTRSTPFSGCRCNWESRGGHGRGSRGGFIARDLAVVIGVLVATALKLVTERILRKETPSTSPCVSVPARASRGHPRGRHVRTPAGAFLRDT